MLSNDCSLQVHLADSGNNEDMHMSGLHPSHRFSELKSNKPPKYGYCDPGLSSIAIDKSDTRGDSFYNIENTVNLNLTFNMVSTTVQLSALPPQSHAVFKACNNNNVVMKNCNRKYWDETSSNDHQCNENCQCHFEDSASEGIDF